MGTPEHPFSSLEHVLKRTLQRVEPPPRFVHGLGHKIRVLPSRPIVNKVNGAAFLLLVLISALLMGAVSALLARLLRRKSTLS